MQRKSVGWTSVQRIYQNNNQFNAAWVRRFTTEPNLQRVIASSSSLSAMTEKLEMILITGIKKGT